ncbi:Toll/IL-1 receptor-like protein, IL-1, NFkB signaling inhibitor [Eptesipox virus]|uniref:Toll/IL-1 receptor-like protein, IL-1, NFkB signaling inhibitor n=1 Tax=Eptesipox virus TaxID=1329402 RepID=A0A220T6L3_9POXV|nr:Toll/IL-1 receptor-like protein, IL-1, NFkB signaling inhibitor [Eptesipox virus]ASK51354.1 Toll/IL-1 receptor-like protein, IL-1, NFkB signaling inhibitor [Eptesipox virus]WAH71112.1 toll/IL-1 receptor-like protein, IL-1, NFkB signaling inhibitor [Eptesipox virus]
MDMAKITVKVTDENIIINVSETSLPILVTTDGSLQPLTVVNISKYSNISSNLLANENTDDYTPDYKEDFLESEDIFDFNNISNIIHNYFWYRGFVGIHNKNFGRVFKELKLYDNEARRKYGSIETLFKILDLTSTNAVKNFCNFIKFQKNIIKTVSEFDAIEMIGLCALVLEKWRHLDLKLNWFTVVSEFFNYTSLEVRKKLKSSLQQKLAYEELN